MRVRPRSSAKNAWLLSPPSIVLLFNNPEIPRKLIKPKVPSGTAPGVSRAKLDQRRPLMGSSLMEVWLMLLEKSCWEVLMTGASEVTSTVLPEIGPIERSALILVSRPISTVTLSAVYGLKPEPLMVAE